MIFEFIIQVFVIFFQKQKIGFLSTEFEFIVIQSNLSKKVVKIIVFTSKLTFFQKLKSKQNKIQVVLK